MDIQPLSIVGYGDRPVPASMILHSGDTDRLGVILPGYRHTVDMPDLHYIGRILLAAGADVLRVEYAYPQTDFMKRPQDEQADWLSQDVRAACSTGMQRRDYKRFTLVGKSLGSLGVGHLLENPRFAAAACIWSTPILANGWLCAQIKKHRPPSLFIIGTADHFYQPEILQELKDVTRGEALVLEGVNHGLEIEGDVAGTYAALGRIIEAVREFTRE